MVEGRKYVRIGREVDYDVYYDDESGEVWVDDWMGEEDGLINIGEDEE